MTDYLISHAIKNVWCTPDQDDQFIFRLNKLTPYGGVSNEYKHHWEYVKLPESNARFHIYHIGQIHPNLINLIDKRDYLDRQNWCTFTEAMNNNNVIVDLYINNGLELPRFNSYFLMTRNNDFIVAVRDRKDIDLNKNELYFRTYQNAYFNSVRSLPLQDRIETNGSIVESNAKINELQVKINELSKKPGHVHCYVNGYRRSNITLVNAKVGDVVEYVYDSSVSNIQDFRVQFLPTFDSVLDKKGKYLLRASSFPNIINYQDDIDVYLVHKPSDKAVYVHKNNRDTFRNLTHKDFSIVVPYIKDYIVHFLDSKGNVNLNDVYIRLINRKSGYNRPLVFEVNRINELYKLGDVKIQNAMVGLNANLDIWKAENLEKSRYTELMKYDYKDFTLDKVVETYGYDAISSLVGKTPNRVYLEGSSLKANVPDAYRLSSTVYEYNTEGVMLGFYPHINGSTYVCKNMNTSIVEFIYGIGGSLLNEYANTSISLSQGTEFRVYRKSSGYWEDITNSNLYTVDSNDQLVFNKSVNFTETPCIVRTNERFIAMNYTTKPTMGIYKIGLYYNVIENGVTKAKVFDVGMGEIDVFLNGYTLVPDLDYYIKNNAVYIVNKSFLQSTNKVHVRMTGFCNSDLTLRKDCDLGYIQQGRVSDDHYFDIKDGKVQRIVVGGKLRMFDTVKYFEDDAPVSVFNEDNGKPYYIRDLVVPIKSYTTTDTYSIKDKDRTTDKLISDYLTNFINQVSNPSLSVIQEKHYLFSPFLNNVLEAIKYGTFTDFSKVPDRYDTEYITTLCKPYEYLLEFDPIYSSNKPPKDYVVIHAHMYPYAITLDFVKYKMFDNIVKLYAKDVVEINTQVSLM